MSKIHEGEVTAKTIREALVQHYSDGGWSLAWEVGNAGGFDAKRWADCVALNLWPSRGHAVHGIEIKVSRSDWLRELEKPEKAEAFHQHCNQWWIAARAGIVVSSELPEGWGLLEFQVAGRRSGGLAVVKPAASQSRSDLPRGFVAAFVKAIHRKDDAELNARLKEIVEKRLSDAKQHWEDQQKRQREDAGQRLAKIEAALRAAGISEWSYDSDELAAAVAFVVKGDFFGKYSAIKRASDELSGAETAIRLLRENLDSVLADAFPKDERKAA